MIQENEIPKYLKSTENNISKSNRKIQTQASIRRMPNSISLIKKHTNIYLIVQLLYYLWKDR